ncbi:hypothetical protein CR918_01035 [Stenotrophomonas indicatrix]|jgi:hypothetical protein|nr:hypothetical protein CR918_01035 [Stenotrophomonas indicatrix]
MAGRLEACDGGNRRLFLVYLSTPQDLAWHLQTSAVRVRQPVVLLLFLAATVAVWRADPAAPATPDPR